MTLIWASGNGVVVARKLLNPGKKKSIETIEEILALVVEQHIRVGNYMGIFLCKNSRTNYLYF